MEINLRIESIEMPECTYDRLVLSHSNSEVNFEKNVTITFRKFHNTILGETKILLMKKAFPWDLCSGVVLLNNSFFRNRKETHEYSARILHRRYLHRANSYEFKEKEVVGKIRYRFSRRMIIEEDVSSFVHSGFMQRLFGFFLNNEKLGTMLSVKELMDYINSGSHYCKMNILFGGVLVEKWTSGTNARLTRNIDPVLSVYNDEIPNMFKEYGSFTGRTPTVDAAGSPGGGVCTFNMHNFRLKISENCQEAEKTSMERVLSSDGYRICNLNMLLKVKRLFYFAVGSYANSWPSIFLNSQKLVGSDVPKNRRIILQVLGIDDKDLLSISLSSSDVVQHIVFYDREENRMVVSFKGTTNPEDTMLDINCEYIQFGDGFAHSGFKKLSAGFVKYRVGYIKRILRNFGSHKLLLTGHSLGGAISILVNIMLREEGALEDIEVETIAFSPPPVISENIAQRFKDGIIVINYGNDIIPRMSYGSVLDLKFLCCSIGEKWTPLNSDTSIRNEIEAVQSYLKKTDIHPKLYVPGELIHIKRVRCSFDSNKNPFVAFKVVNRDFFEQIVLIKHAPKHHMLSHMISVVEDGIDILREEAGKKTASARFLYEAMK